MSGGAKDATRRAGARSRGPVHGDATVEARMGTRMRIGALWPGSHLRLDGAGTAPPSAGQDAEPPTVRCCLTGVVAEAAA